MIYPTLVTKQSNKNGKIGYASSTRITDFGMDSDALKTLVKEAITCGVLADEYDTMRELAIFSIACVLMDFKNHTNVNHDVIVKAVTELTMDEWSEIREDMVTRYTEGDKHAEGILVELETLRAFHEEE